MSLKIGDTFSSYVAFSEKLKLFQQETCTQFTIINSEKLLETDVVCDVFKYSVLRYGCKQGRLKRQPTDGGKRPKQRTFKVGCPVKLNVRLNRPKGKDAFLKVTSLEMEHQNHDTSKEMFKLYPEQRRFDVDETSATILSSTTMKTSEKRDILEKRHGAAVLMQDVYNKERSVKSGQGRRDTDEEKCEEILRDVVENGGVGVVGRDENGGFRYRAFQTAKMKSLLNNFPQCLIVDCTYKVNNYLYPLLTIMIIDGEGHGLPVFHAFLAKEDTYILEKCLEVFAGQFDSTQTMCFVVDKDMAEIAAIGAIFPNVPINLCHFHISQAVDRYLRKELGRETSGVKVNVVHDLFMNQVCTESEDEFGAFKAEISDIVPQSVIQYFEANWWSKRNLWAACCNVNVVKFHATTTNAFESYLSKIKKKVSDKLTMANTLREIIAFNEFKINEACRQKLIAANCAIYDMTDQNAVMASVTNHVTRFGGDMIKDQISLSEKTAYAFCPTATEDLYDVNFKDRHYSVTLNSCTCSTFEHMQLPCRHIFFLRKSLGQVIFEECLVPECLKLSATLHDVVLAGEVQVVTVQSGAPTSFQTIEEKLQKAKEVCDNIVNFLAILGEREFVEKIGELEDLLGRWAHRADDSSLVTDGVEVDAAVVTDGVEVDAAVVTDGVEVDRSDDVDFAASSSDFSWSKMSKLLKPGGRPRTKQSFTASPARNQAKKRCRHLPKTFQQLSTAEQSLLFIKAVSRHTSHPDSLIQSSELKPYGEFSGIVMDDKVNITFFEPCFEPSAWSEVIDGVNLRRDSKLFYCDHCREVDNIECKMVKCEHCLSWYHFQCVGFSSKMKVNIWFCGSCF